MCIRFLARATHISICTVLVIVFIRILLFALVLILSFALVLMLLCALVLALVFALVFVFELLTCSLILYTRTVQRLFIQKRFE